MKTIERFLVSPTEPPQQNVIWIDSSTLTPSFKIYNNGHWEPTSVSSGKLPSDTSMPEGGMLPNIVYNLGDVPGQTEFIINDKDTNGSDWWFWTFTTASGKSPSYTFPSQIERWANGDIEISADTYYEICVINGVGTCLKAEPVE